MQAKSLNIHLYSLIFVLTTFFLTAFIPWSFSQKSQDFNVSQDSGFSQDSKNLKIVSLSPVITEMLFAIEAGPMVKAVTRWCDEPTQARTLPKIGDISINLESLMLHSPDLILTMKGLRREQINRLISLGMRVVTLEIDRVDQIIPALKKIGRLVSRESQAKKLSVRLKTVFSWVKNKIKDVKRRPRTYIEIWGNPVMTAGQLSFLNDLVVLAGGMNIFGDVKKNYFSVSNEELLIKMPERVLICYPTENKKDFALRPGFKVLPAVRGNRIHHVPLNIYVRPGPRIGEALVDLVKRIHPEKFGFGKSNDPFEK